MEELNNEQTVGIVKISDEVVSVIAGIAAEEIDGIVEFQHGVSSIFKGKKTSGKTVKVTLNENSALIEMAVSVEYGRKIPDVVAKVQENIKRTVEAMTGLSVEAVDIYVQNIYMPKKEEEEELEE
ncbi:MAG: Asp23/Gls24 family envelope stress response protein [Clostridium sp.]|nr:Asp23/Gls24 family envelope stress response protein [Clostridium sp.]